MDSEWCYNWWTYIDTVSSVPLLCGVLVREGCGNNVFSAQFCWEPKAALKIVYLKEMGGRHRRLCWGHADKLPRSWFWRWMCFSSIFLPEVQWTGSGSRVLVHGDFALNWNHLKPLLSAVVPEKAWTSLGRYSEWPFPPHDPRTGRSWDLF